ncbi:protein SGT1 homolog isoform X2 [Rhodamnia argentea]|uniref:Protein SGT1 homolog n=1 Tax=Rhodamnia argentea TaxID=178133 RepID=A0A8B8PDW6_9MYRT|nr:protein SGT1 homolog isoform X2 [Rhodamnia argentea]
MASDLETKAKEAFIDDHFELAADLYSQAISLSPDNAELFADRAQANLKLRNFTGAVADANKAIEIDPSLSKAYFRKGNACYELEEYETAKAAFELGSSLAPGDARFANLIKKCDDRIAEESGDLLDQPLEKASTEVVSVESDQESGQILNEAPNEVTSQLNVKQKYRHEYYQKPEEVVITIFAKGIPAQNVAIDFGEQILSVIIDVPGEDAYHFQPRLFGKIAPEKCRYDVLPSKIEVRLAKAEPLNWTSLDFSKDSTIPKTVTVVSDCYSTHSEGTGSQRPSYPTSKPRRVDWDKLEAQVKKEEKEEKLDGDAALNKFFQDIYKDADEDTRRAMRKSFVESNGTVLSTNWKEVGSKKVEGSPPEGMEVKKWEY